MNMFEIVFSIMVSSAMVYMVVLLVMMTMAEYQDRYWSKRLGCRVIMGQVFAGDNNRTANALQRKQRMDRRRQR